VTGAIAGVPPGIARAAAARAVASWQLPDGHWTTLDVRPPQSFGTITATAMAIHGVEAYWPAGHEPSSRSPRARGARLALEVAPRDTADMVFRLRGLRWTGASAADIAQAPQALRSTQRADGGWGQLPSRSSMPYATGDAMLALHESGLPVTERRVPARPALHSRSPAADGSWRVETRMHEQSLVSRRTSSGLPTRRAPDGLLHGFDAGVMR
jgi:hypothetical protein